MLRIGVVSVQGAFMEHAEMVDRAAAASGIEAVAVDVRRPAHAETCHGFILPGGESTTISKLLDSSGLRRGLTTRIEAGAAALGTCAGAILLASRGDAQVARTGTTLLGLMDIGVVRNAFGRQKDSFEADVEIEGDPTPFPGVFIRAPAIAEHGDGVRPLVRYGDEMVGVEQGRRVALTFHPELGGDPRLHQRLLDHAQAFAEAENA